MTPRTTLAALAASTTALIALAAAPAQAQGVTAGTIVTNTATVDYRVGGVDQTEVVAANSFVVDRRVTIFAAPEPAATVTVSPGQTRVWQAFDIANSSNARLDLGLGVIQASGGAGPFSGGTDTFDVTNVEIYDDTNDNNVWDAGDTLITYIDEIDADSVWRIFVVADVPLAFVVNGQVAVFTLTAEARESGAAGSLGAVVTATSGANDMSQMDTVFADDAGFSDAARDGRYTTRGSFTAFAAELSVTKSTRVISDPVNGTADPKAIPGAVIEYCVAVGNGPSAATATNVIVTDVVPGELAFDTGFGIVVGGTVDASGQCQADGTSGGTFDAGTAAVTAPLNDVPADETRTVRFRATIN